MRELLVERFSTDDLAPETWNIDGDEQHRIRPANGVLMFDLRSPTVGFGSRQLVNPPLNATEITLRERMESCEHRDQGGAGIALFLGSTANPALRK